MFAVFAKYLHHKIGTTVDYFWMLCKCVNRVHHSENSYDAFYFIKIADLRFEC